MWVTPLTAHQLLFMRKLLLGSHSDPIHAICAAREFLLDVAELASREKLLVFGPHVQGTEIEFCLSEAELTTSTGVPPRQGLLQLE